MLDKILTTFPTFFEILKIFLIFLLTTIQFCIIITKLRFGAKFGGVAQLARAFGSYPNGHWFKSSRRYHGRVRTLPTKRPVGQAVKTPPFHGGNRSSILLRVTKKRQGSLPCRFCYTKTWQEKNSCHVLYFTTILNTFPVHPRASQSLFRKRRVFHALRACQSPTELHKAPERVFQEDVQYAPS